MGNCTHYFCRQMLPSGYTVDVCMKCNYQHYNMPCSFCNEDGVKHQFEIHYRVSVTLCDSCYFKYQVMRAAGREWEFIGECRIPRYERMPEPFPKPFGSYW